MGKTLIPRELLAQHFADMVKEALGRATVLAIEGKEHDACVALIHADAYRAAANIVVSIDFDQSTPLAS
jgi:hypothetical protein